MTMEPLEIQGAVVAGAAADASAQAERSGELAPGRGEAPGESADLSADDVSSIRPTRSEAQRTGAKERSAMRKVALDLGARKIHFCEVAGDGVVGRRTVGSLHGLADVLGEGAAPAVVAIEACREAWYVAAELERNGHEVVLVDTSRVRQLGIGHHGRKTDRIDAEVLARALARGGIPVAHRLSPARQQLRKELSVRRVLVGTRAQHVTTARGLMRAEGMRLATCDTENFVAHVRRAPLSSEQRKLVAPLLELLAVTDLQIVEVDARLEALCAEEPTIGALTTAPGVGLIVAAAFVSVIDDAKRFRHAHQVEAYLGLVPSENSSGERRRIGAITKQGNAYVRSLLVQAAWAILRLADRSDPLRVWAEGIVERRSKSVAVVAVARRLAGVLWAMWRDGTVYEAARLGASSARGLARSAQDAQVRADAMKRAANKMKIRTRGQRRKERSATTN